jgi:hypothetical protein
MLAVTGSGNASEAAARGAGGSRALVGVHQDVVAQSHDYARTAIAAAKGSLGAQVSRSTLRWNIVEPNRGQLDWSHADFVVGELRAAEIEPLFVLLGSPTWANGVAEDISHHEFYVPTEQASFDRWLTEFTAFARAAARRYRGEVRLWEVWNEPNEHFDWLPEPSAARYAQVYRAVSDAIHSESPEARVAVGGLAGVGAGCCISGVEFTRSLITAGIPMDAVALHPYPSNGHAPDVHVQWQDNFDDIGAVRELLDTSGRSQVEVWVTEWGWSSSAVGAETQATYVRRSLEMLRDRFSYVSVATMFLDADRPGQYDYGLLGSDFVPKPSGAAFAAFMRERATGGAPAAPPGVSDPSTTSPSTPVGDSHTDASPSTPAPDDGASAPGAEPPTPALATPAFPLSEPRAERSQVLPAKSRKRPLRLVSSGFALEPETARAGRPLVATMRVARSDTKRPVLGQFTANAKVLGKRLVLRSKRWYRTKVHVEFRIPVWARGRTVAGSITVRYHGATITRRFSTRVR